MTEAERCLLAITNGVDQFGGNSESGPIVEAYKIGCEKYGEKAMRERMELSAKRLLINIFHCGLFEDPYLDPEESAKIVGCEEFCRHGYEAQQKSIVLLKNSAKRAPEGQKGVLPLKKGLKVYIPERKIGPSKAFFRIDLPAKTEDPLPDGLPSKYGTRVASPEEADVALVPGLVGAAAEIAAILVIMNLLINRARKRGEHFELHPLDPRYDSTGSKPKLIVALIPMVVLFLLFNIWKLNINICLLCSIALSLVLFWPQLRRRDLKGMLNSGAVDSVPMTMTVAAICGFAGVITNTDAFQSMITAITSISIAPILICWGVVDRKSVV